MKRSVPFGIACFFFTSILFGQVTSPQESLIAHPMETARGIVFTDAQSTSLYLAEKDSIEILLTAPGCGMYTSLSPDRLTIGFKYISEDGLQTPALLNIATKEIILLHDPVLQAGQVNFTPNGTITYSIGNNVYIQHGSDIQKIPIKTYSNIVALSADENYIAYNDDNNRMFVYNRSTKSSEQITSSGAGYFLPIWSPTENKLCFSRLDASLFVRDMDNQTTFSLGEGYNPVWSLDGQSIIAERREIEKQVLVNSVIYKISADGKNAYQLTVTTDLFETEPSVVDNNTIIFRSHNNNNVYVKSTQEQVPASVEYTIKKLPIPKKNISENFSLKKNSSATVYFEMPYTNQVYDTPDWYNGHSACGPTSSIMVIAYYGLLPEWKVWCSYSSPAHWSLYGNYVCEKYRFRQIDFVLPADDPNGKSSWGGYGYMWSTGSPHTRMAGYYSLHGLTAATQETPSLSFVTDEVTNGHPYTLCNGLTTAGHIIVINGIGAEAHTLIVNDPYGNKNSGSYPSKNGKGVSYDWPGYNNGFKNLNTVYWGVTVRYTPPALGDSIVDDLQFFNGFMMCNSSPSSMYSWKDVNTGFNNHMWYVKTKKSDTCFASWTPTISKDGNYEVSAFIPYSNTTAARYIIHHAGGIDTVTANQKPIKNDWLSLGTFPFTTSGSQYVRLGDGSDSTGQEIVFDAIQWKYTSPLSVDLASTKLPSTIDLEQNYPNPFNPTTKISFSVTKVSQGFHVTLKVYSILGREVATLVDNSLSAGEYSVPFNAGSLSSGIYVYRLQVGETTISKRMLLLR